MRAEAHQAQRVGVGLLVDQHQVGLDVAIPVILPVPGQRVVAVPMSFSEDDSTKYQK